MINQDLEKLAKEMKPVIVHTDLTGNRGIDFKFAVGLVHVVLAFEPQASVDIV